MSATRSGAFRWTLLVVLTAAFTLSFLARMVWAPLIGDAASDLGFQPADAGVFMSLFYVGYMITQLPGGMLADRFGVKAVLSISVLVTGVFSLLLAVVDSWGLALFLRFIAGLGSGAIVSSSTRSIAREFPPERRSTALGVFFVATTAGLLLANSIAPKALEVGTWRTAFVWVGVATTLLSVVIYLIVPPEERALDGPGPLDGLASVIRSRGIVLMLLVGFCYIAVSISVATWANHSMSTMGISVTTAAQIMMRYSIAGIVATVLSGWLVDTFRINRRWYVISCFAAIAVMTLVFSAQTSVVGLSIAAVIYGFVTYLPNAHLTTLMLERARSEFPGTAMGVSNVVWQSGAVVAPAVSGWLFAATNNFSTVWAFLAALCVVGLAPLFFLRPTTVSQVA